MGKNINDFESFNEGLSIADAKDAIKDIFKKFNGKVADSYLKNVWEKDSTLRNLFGKDIFDKAWNALVKAGSVETENGKTWILK